MTSRQISVFIASLMELAEQCAASGRQGRAADAPRPSEQKLLSLHDGRACTAAQLQRYETGWPTISRAMLLTCSRSPAPAVVMFASPSTMRSAHLRMRDQARPRLGAASGSHAPLM